MSVIGEILESSLVYFQNEMVIVVLMPYKHYVNLIYFLLLALKYSNYMPDKRVMFNLSSYLIGGEKQTIAYYIFALLRTRFNHLK